MRKPHVYADTLTNRPWNSVSVSDAVHFSVFSKFPLASNQSAMETFEELRIYKFMLEVTFKYPMYICFCSLAKTGRPAIQLSRLS